MRHKRLPVLKGDVLRCFRSGCARAFFWESGEMFKFVSEMISSGNVLPSQGANRERLGVLPDPFTLVQYVDQQWLGEMQTLAEE